MLRMATTRMRRRGGIVCKYKQTASWRGAITCSRHRRGNCGVAGKYHSGESIIGRQNAEKKRSGGMGRQRKTKRYRVLVLLSVIYQLMPLSVMKRSGGQNA